MPPVPQPDGYQGQQQSQPAYAAPQSAQSAQPPQSPQYAAGQYDNPSQQYAGQPYGQSSLPPQGAPYPNAPYQGVSQQGVPQYAPAGGTGSGVPPLNKPHYGIGFTAAVGRFFQKYAVFTGRASRGEFWWVILFLFLASIVIGLVTIPLPTGASTWIARLWNLATLIPLLAVGVRRLHDTNKPTAWILLPALPMIVAQGISWSVQAPSASMLSSDLTTGSSMASYLTVFAVIGVLELFGLIAAIVLFVGATNPNGVQYDEDYQANQYQQPGQYQGPNQYQAGSQMPPTDQQSYPQGPYPQQ